MLVFLRFRVESAGLDGFLARARTAVEVLGARPGFIEARVGRALDDPELMVLQLEFDEVGSYRRALSSYEVKMNAVQLLSEAIDEPSAFEVLHGRTPDQVVDSESSVAPDHDTFSVGQ